MVGQGVLAPSWHQRRQFTTRAHCVIPHVFTDFSIECLALSFPTRCDRPSSMDTSCVYVNKWEARHGLLLGCLRDRTLSPTSEGRRMVAPRHTGNMTG